MKKILMFFIACISLISLAQTSSIESASQIYFNSESYYDNYRDLTSNFFLSKFNTTFIVGDKLWVPWFDSSTACALTNLKSDYTASPNWTWNSMVSDEFSEIGVLLSLSNESLKFQYWANMSYSLDGLYGNLPCWAAIRNGNNFYCASNDTASDATARIGMAFYYAARNKKFSVGLRNMFLETANNISRDHIIYESKNECYNNTWGNTETCYWVGGGRDAALNFQSDPFIYTGYFPDLISLMLLAYEFTNNITFYRIAEDYTEQYLLATNWTGTGFRVAPYSWRWNVTTNPPTIWAGNTYYFDSANAQWDDSDASRTLGLCHNLRIANISTYGDINSTALTNLTSYCTNWLATGTYNSTLSCIQYYYNGSCATTIRTGYFENGLGAGLHTYLSTDTLQDKVNESVGHYAFGNPFTMDYSGCYGVYRGVRPAKALATMIGLTDDAYGDHPYEVNLTLYEDFNDNSLNIYKWVNGTLAGGNITEKNNRLELNITNAAGGGLVEIKTYLSFKTLTGNITFNVVAGAGNGGTVKTNGVSITGNLNSLSGKNITIITVNDTLIRAYQNNEFLKETVVNAINDTLTFSLNYGNIAHLFIDNLYIGANKPALEIDNCNGDYSENVFVNFTMKDENNFTVINTTFAASFTYWETDINDNHTYLFNNEYANQSNYKFCFNQNNSNFYYNLDSSYSQPGGYSTRNYYLREHVMNITTEEVDLYLLHDDDSEKFYVTVQEGLTELTDSRVYVKKYYTGLGEYQTVAIRLTDDEGEFVEYFDLDDKYLFEVYDSSNNYVGSIIRIINCQTTFCTLTLNILSNLSNPFNTYYNTFGGQVAYNLTYNTTTKLVTLSYIDLTGTATAAKLTVFRVVLNETRDVICENVTFAVSGTITCDMTGYEDGSFIAQAEIARSPYVVFDYLSFIISSVAESLGIMGIFISLILLITVFFAFSYNQSIGVMMAVLTVTILSLVNILPISIVYIGVLWIVGGWLAYLLRG